MKSGENSPKAGKTTVSSGGESYGRRENVGVVLAAGGLVWRESSRGKELAVIHRGRYGDWTLPKGKLFDDEKWEDAALREVKEETGIKGKLGSFAGCVSYVAKGTPKIVLFWDMAVEDEFTFKPSAEVDQLVWLPVREAFHRLDYPRERSLIMGKSSFLCEMPSSGSRLRKLFWSAEHRRLAETIGPYRAELEHLIGSRTEQKEGGELIPSWAVAARDLLDSAQDGLDKNNIELGWRYFAAAQQMEIYGLDEPQLRMKAQAVLNEADKKLDSWRKKTVRDLLVGEKDSLKPKVSLEEVAYACSVLQEHFTNQYRKLRVLRRQLFILQIVAVLAVLTWLSAFMPSLNGQVVQINNSTLLVSVALFGVMGGAISGMLSITEGSAKARIPEQLLTEMVTLARPIIGAVAALAVFAFLVSGLLQVGEVATGLILAVSFASGFSERLVMRAVETVA